MRYGLVWEWILSGRWLDWDLYWNGHTVVGVLVVLEGFVRVLKTFEGFSYSDTKCSSSDNKPDMYLAT